MTEQIAVAGTGINVNSVLPGSMAESVMPERITGIRAIRMDGARLNPLFDLLRYLSLTDIFRIIERQLYTQTGH